MTNRMSRALRVTAAGGLLATGLVVAAAAPANAAIYKCVQWYGTTSESWLVQCYDNGGPAPHEFRAKATCTDGFGHFQTRYGSWKIATSTPPTSVATCSINWFLNGPGTVEKR